MRPFARGEIWGDGVGGARALAIDFEAGELGDLFIGEDCEILLHALCGGLAPTRIRVDLQFSTDNGATFWRMTRQETDSAGLDQIADRQLNGEGAGPHLFRVVVPRGILLRVLVRRVGGDATTTCFVQGSAHAPSAGEGGGGGGGAGAYEYLEQCFSNAAGAAGFAIADGAWTTTQNAAQEWHAAQSGVFGSVQFEATVAGGPTAFRMRLRRRAVGGTTVYRPVASNSIVAGVEDVSEHVYALEIVTGNRCVPIAVEPGHEYAVDFWRTGGASITVRADISLGR